MNCAESGHDTEPLEGSYFVSTYPPFSVWNEQDVAAYCSVLSRASPTENPLGLYVHVPFCQQRCSYCYFLSQANPDDALIGRYVDGLLQELAWHAEAPALAGRELSFVYFGGGTPSMLSPERIHRIMAGIKRCFPWSNDPEVVFECAPRTTLPDRLVALKEEGVTRLSMGVQQLDDDVLRQNRRIHTVHDVEQAWRSVQEVGFDVTNLDLMVGLAGETDTSFFGSLERVIAMAADSVTIYQLEIPLNTPLYRSLSSGRTDLRIPSWQTKRRRLIAAFAVLEQSGYTLRSAYSAVRDPARHRFVYQDAQYRGADLLGVGASSFSFIGGVHHQNLASLRGYLDCVDRGELPLGRAYALSNTEQCVREFVLQLKLGGSEVSYFRDRFGIDVLELFAEPLEHFTRQEWLEVSDEDVSVTREGLARVDLMITSFYLEPHRNVRYS